MRLTAQEAAAYGFDGKRGKREPMRLPKRLYQLIQSRLALVVDVPLKTVSGMNVREHWSERHKRSKLARAEWLLAAHTIEAFKERPKLITLCRLGPRELDTDNLAAAGKHLRDAIAEWIGCDDNQLQWAYTQVKSKEYGVRVSLEW